MIDSSPAGVELLCDQSLVCGEGPVWDARQEALYWTDGGREIVYRLYDECQVFYRGTHAASVTLHAAGGLMLCGSGGFHHLTPGATVRPVCVECDGLPVTHVNDIIADPVGRVFGGQETFRDDGPYEPGYLYRVDPDGRAAIVEEGLHLSNGMGFSPGLDTFYLVDTILRHVYAYDYRVESGEIRNRRVLVTLDRENGLPDGLTVDAEGFLWVARYFGGGVSRYDPDGRLERTIELPAAQPTSVTFGGRDFTDLYVTSAAQRWESKLAPAGQDYTRHRGGGLYRVIPGIQGRPEFMARV